jgi:hypothetical protein
MRKSGPHLVDSAKLVANIAPNDTKTATLLRDEAAKKAHRPLA